MNPTCVDSFLRDLSQLGEDLFLTSSREAELEILKRECRFLKIYLWCSAKWNEALRGKNKKNLASVRKSHINTTLRKARKKLCRAGGLAKRKWMFGGWDMTREFGDWDILVSNLLERIQNYMPEIKQGSLDWLNSSIRCKFSSDELHEFMEFVKFSLGYLVSRLNKEVTNTIAEKKMLIETLQEKLNLFTSLFSFAVERCSSEKELNALRIHLQAWAYKTACLSLLYWTANEEDGEENKELNILLSNLLRKIRPPCNREVTGLCLRVLKASERLGRSESFRVDELVSNLLVFLLENLDSPLKGSVGILQSELELLITISMDPSITKKYGDDDKILLTKEHEENEKSSSTAGNDESIVTPVSPVDAALDEALDLIHSLYAKEFSEEITKQKFQSFLDKINIIKAKIRKRFCFPRTNILGFTDRLLENLKEILKSEFQFSPSTKHEIEIVQEGLLSLRTFFEDFIEQQNEQEQLKDIQTRIFSMPYMVDLAIKSFLYLDDSRGYGMLCPCLSDVTKEMKFIRGEIKKIQDHQMHKFGQLRPAMISSSPMSSANDNTSRIDDDVVGFNDEAKSILELLKRESKQLEMICIYGMPGQGKTTLANKVYNDLSIQRHFYKRAWCCVSQDFKSRKVLLEILSHLIADTSDISEKKVEELEDELRKCLWGQKYLIVLDDIWDIKAWKALEKSFPDKSKGSKILFTSRGNLTKQGEIDCIPHHLKPLSDEESWELLKMKINAKCKPCPQHVSNVGMKIAEKCRGLPLTIVLIAGLIANNAQNLDWWNQIEKQLGSGTVYEECKETLELSYKHLPEHLKPCFLYFGSFPEDRAIKVQKLTQLWISEQLIQKTTMERLEHVAREYLMDMVNRSLVTVTNRSSHGGIKECRVHDLLHEFCLVKGKEENFLRVINENDVSRCSLDAMYEHYRLCIHEGSWRHSNPFGPFVHSLLFFPAFGGFSNLDGFSSLKYKLLQVLDLEEVNFKICFPEEISMLVLLRYFAICCSASCTYIPHSIARLVNLEYIHVKRDFYFPMRNSFGLPSVIWSMKKLRYVDVGYSDFLPLDSGSNDAEFCLDNVHTFKIVRLSGAGFAKKLLRRIPNVRKLSCRIEVGDGEEDTDQMLNLDILSQLESLYIRSFGGSKCSLESILPLSLRKLTLSYTYLEWRAIFTIGKMPNLEVLKLLYRSFLGERWDMEDYKFSKLRFLKLSDLRLKHWNASDYAFPYLQRLVVVNCRELEEIPSSFGEILTLERIEVKGCMSTVNNSVGGIQEEQLGLGNRELQVIITESLQ